jgi:mannosyltransferase
MFGCELFPGVEATTTVAQSAGARALPRVSVIGAAAVGLIALGAVIRFGTIGIQSYHHDEVVTAARILPGSFGHMLHEVRVSESTPPLYYAIAWLWSAAFGLTETALRSLSALFGVLTIPVAFMIGRELAGRRAALLTAAIVAVNPMLIWYSQEARAYALLILLCSCSLLFFLRFRRTRESGDLALWALSSALAIATHYFAAFPIAIEGAWLLLASRFSGRVWAAVAGICAAAAALVPLLLDQANPHHITWIDHSALSLRLIQSGSAALIGETGKVIGATPRDGFAVIPALLVGAALALVALRGSRREQRGAAIALTVGLGGVGLAVGAALAGKDYILARNLLPALVPLAAVTGVALAASRARKVGVALAVLLCGYFIAFDVYVAETPSLQRPNFESVADALGPAQQPRAIIGWALAGDPLDYYLGGATGKPSVWPLRVRELDVVAKHNAARVIPRLAARFPQVQEIPLGRLTIVRYRSPRLLDIHYRQIRRLKTGFNNDAIVVDGVPRPPAATPVAPQLTIAGRSALAAPPTG